MKKILIIPDVHGRTFWKEAIDKLEKEVDKIIFLGDYLDPYGYEGISWEDALDNFKEILEYKKQFKDKIVLLEGNHDAHYHFCERWARYGRGSRYSSFYSSKIQKIFLDNDKLFQTAYLIKGKTRTYLFTHAGVTTSWLKQNNLTLPEDDSRIPDWLDNLYRVENKYNYMGDVGRSRGGWSPSGSPMWADFYDDHLFHTEQDGLENKEHIYQIFGHTQGNGNRICNNIACLDNRKAYILDLETEKIEEV